MRTKRRILVNGCKLYNREYDDDYANDDNDIMNEIRLKFPTLMISKSEGTETSGWLQLMEAILCLNNP